MLAALTGVVHHSQRAHGHEHKRAQHNDQGAFHSYLAPRAAHWPNFLSSFGNEPRVNASALRCSKKSPRPNDHPLYAMTIVAAIAVVKAKASAIAAKIIRIACS